MAKKLLLTAEIKEEICQSITSTHLGLPTLCSKNPHWGAYSTIRRYLVSDIDFGQRYNLAKQLQADFMVEGLIEIAKNCLPLRNEIDKARLEIDTIKWAVGVLKPRSYANKVFNGNLDKDGDPTDQKAQLDLSKLTNEELKKFLELQKKAESK